MTVTVCDNLLLAVVEFSISSCFGVVEQVHALLNTLATTYPFDCAGDRGGSRGYDRGDRDYSERRHNGYDRGDRGYSRRDDYYGDRGDRGYDRERGYGSRDDRGYSRRDEYDRGDRGSDRYGDRGDRDSYGGSRGYGVRSPPP